MKYSIKPIVTTAFFLAALLGSDAYAAKTNPHVVERIQVADSGFVYLRPVLLDHWGDSEGGSDCPEPTYVRLYEHADNFEAMFNAAMASKLNGTPIKFYGTCSSTGSTVYADYLIMY